MSSHPNQLELKLPSFLDGRPVSKKLLTTCAVLVVVLYGALWSPYWYPLSDSALYLSIGKSLANGEGFQFLGETNRLSAPLTPIMIAIVLRLGGSFGTLHFLMIGFMLLGLALTYATLKHWVGERAALAATMAASISFWVVQCTTTVMTEPLCLTLFWGMLYCLTRSTQTEAIKSRSLWLVTALLLFLASFENRAAMILLLPGLVLAYWLMAGHVASRVERLTWVTCFCLVLGTAFWDYRYAGHAVGYVSQLSEKMQGEFVAIETIPSSQEASVVMVSSANIPGEKEAEDIEQESEDIEQENAGKEETIIRSAKTYEKNNTRYDFEIPPTSKVIRYPLYFGRWICEGLMAPTVAFFQTKNPWLLSVGWMISITALLLTILGLWLMMVQRQWWVLALVSYCLPIWIMWAGRIIPRYMVPIAPVLFLLLWYAISWTALKVRDHLAAGNGRELTYGRLGLAGLLGLLIIGNFPPLAVEVYLRHHPNRNFYQIARRGATKELLQIGSYIRSHSEAEDIVGVNARFFHRVVHFVTEKPVRYIAKRPLDPETMMREIDFRYVIVFSTDPPWPNWHLPWTTETTNHSWWRLYVRNPDGNYAQVDPSNYEPSIRVVSSTTTQMR